MTASVAGRSTCLRMMCRISMSSGTRGVLISPARSSIQGNLLPRRTPFSHSSCRLLRRELSSLRPFHSAIAFACLVSKLPTESLRPVPRPKVDLPTISVLSSSGGLTEVQELSSVVLNC